jgi:hypothetical protein
MCGRKQSRWTAGKQGIMLKNRALRKNHFVIDYSTVGPGIYEFSKTGLMGLDGGSMSMAHCEESE